MRRYLVAACVAALALAGIGQAGAYFTDQVSVADNVITAGALEISCEPTSSALSIPTITPGSAVDRTLTVANDGSLPADIVVTGAKKAGFTAFYEALTCRVLRGDTVLYEGGLSALRTAATPIPAGGSADLAFEIGLPDDAGNDIQGDYVRLTLYVDAEQTHP